MPDPDSRSAPIPVICDRCRAEGHSEEDPFEAFGALLDFDPVPRRTPRADGWDAATQRAFVAALSLTGSARQAARAVGKAAYGAEQLLRHEESEGFRAACEQAMAIAADERGRRLAEGVRRAADEAVEARRVADPPWAKAKSRHGPAAPAPAAPETHEAAAARQREEEAIIERLIARYLLRLRMEREARLAGKIVEADLYVRQITFLEVIVDLLANGRAALLLDRFRTEHGSHLVLVAETPLSREMDDARRAQWAALAEPDRPPPPPDAQLIDRGRYKVNTSDSIQGGPDWRDRWAAKDAEYAAAAVAQVEWEAEALRQAEAWREANAAERNDADA